MFVKYSYHTYVVSIYVHTLSKYNRYLLQHQYIPAHTHKKHLPSLRDALVLTTEHRHLDRYISYQVEFRLVGAGAC